MSHAARIIKGVLMLAAAAFIVMVIVGIYTALDAAPSYSLASSRQVAGPLTGALAGRADLAVGEDVSGAGGAAEDEAGPAAGLGSDGEGAGEGAPAATQPAATQPATAASPDHKPAAFAGDTPSEGSTGADAGFTGTGSGASGSAIPPGAVAPAPAPAKTYHPAWDEWVAEGHWETVEVPAVYGQREVYGSVCNECGADVSGQATAHLKATHHSGYHEGIVGYETYEISPATSERVWVDTSHWVHHEGYWQ
jgi:hypothetical protein